MVLTIKYYISTGKVMSQKMNFVNMVEKLPTETARKILDLLNNVSNTNPYNLQRNTILLTTGESEEGNLTNLFSEECIENSAQSHEKSPGVAYLTRKYLLSSID